MATNDENETDDVVESPNSDALGMSDEDFGKVDIGAVSLQANEAPVAAAAEEDESNAETDPATAEDADEDKETVEEAPQSDDSDAKEDGVSTETAKPDEPVAADKEEQPVDYKAAYDRLFAPFKANGKEIAVSSVEDAIELMQMGANYNKKMAALKPNLKVLKLLENNGLLDESKLSYLIDLDKKNPEAINKLIKDSGIDPLDLSNDKAAEYKPGNYKVDDVELELDAVLDEIQHTPTYNRTLDVVSNQWDTKSKQVIANTPQILKLINAQMQNGIYDVIQAEIEKERVYGRLNGLSDIEAYRQVGDAIHARGGFDHLGHQRQQTPAPVVVVPKPKAVDDDKLKEKKRAASVSKPSVSNSAPADFNPLALSDAEYSKVANSKYL